MDLDRIKARAAEIAEREGKELLTRTTASEKLYQRAVKSLPGGVVSNFQASDPYPVYLKAGNYLVRLTLAGASNVFRDKSGLIVVQLWPPLVDFQRCCDPTNSGADASAPDAVPKTIGNVHWKRSAMSLVA